MDTLVSSGHLPDLTALDYKVRDSAQEWRYFPGLTGRDKGSILLSGPAHGQGRKRILVFVDGSVQILEEHFAQEHAANQGVNLP